MSNSSFSSENFEILDKLKFSHGTSQSPRVHQSISHYQRHRYTVFPNRSLYTVVRWRDIIVACFFFVYSSYKLVLLRNNTISLFVWGGTLLFLVEVVSLFFPHGPVIINRLSSSFYSSMFVGDGPPLRLEPRNRLVCRWTFPTPVFLCVALGAFVYKHTSTPCARLVLYCRVFFSQHYRSRR